MTYLILVRMTPLFNPRVGLLIESLYIDNLSFKEINSSMDLILSVAHEENINLVMLYMCNPSLINL